MTEGGSGVGQVWGIPAAARDAWSELAEVLHRDGPAPCEEGTPDAWWPTRDADSTDTTLAARCCTDCPARVECLTYALAADEQDGIWGGLTASERVSPARSATAA